MITVFVLRFQASGHELTPWFARLAHSMQTPFKSHPSLHPAVQPRHHGGRLRHDSTGFLIA